jgi:hypothetical protein
MRIVESPRAFGMPIQKLDFMTQAPALWTFDDFEPGRSFGRMEIRLDSRRLALWSQVFGENVGDNEVSSSVLVAAMMEGYLKLLQPRPPGNVHASQVLSFTGRQVQLGAALTASVKCHDKYLKTDRRWVIFHVALAECGQEVMSGDITTIWAR